MARAVAHRAQCFNSHHRCSASIDASLSRKDQPGTTRRATYDPAPREAVVVGEGVSRASFEPPSGAVPARDARLTTHTRQTQRFVTLDADSKSQRN